MNNYCAFAKQLSEISTPRLFWDDLNLGRQGDKENSKTSFCAQN